MEVSDNDNPVNRMLLIVNWLYCPTRRKKELNHIKLHDSLSNDATCGAPVVARIDCARAINTKIATRNSCSILTGCRIIGSITFNKLKTNKSVFFLSKLDY